MSKTCTPTYPAEMFVMSSHRFDARQACRDMESTRTEEELVQMLVLEGPSGRFRWQWDWGKRWSQSPLFLSTGSLRSNSRKSGFGTDAPELDICCPLFGKSIHIQHGSE